MSFGFESAYGLVIIQAELWGPTGSTVLRMALDTGATTTLINADPLEWVGYEPALSSDRVQITTGSGVESAALVKLHRISALGQERTDCTVVCHTLPPSTNVDGLLGLDFLRGQSVRLDFRQGEIILRNSNKTVREKGDRHILLRRLRKMSQSPPVLLELLS